MTDYEKLKAFAEELDPLGKNCCQEHNGKVYLWNYSNIKEGFGIYGSDGSEVWIKPCGEERTNIPKDLDQWINETREYWREHGLPSLQKEEKEVIKKELKTNKKTIMKNIKDTLKALTHSKDDKALIKAGLKRESGEWSTESREFALEQIVDEQLAVAKFKEQMIKVAAERNKECK